MIYQEWHHNRQWEKTDPKLSQLCRHPFVLPHTKNLVDKIAFSPAGVLVIRGPRQTGKSTLLRQIVQKALTEKIPSGNIGLIEAESLGTRHDLLGEIKQFRSTHGGFDLLLIDEITSIDEWWLALKVGVDDNTLAQTLVICTGSSAIELSEGVDLLPGRRGARYPVDFELLPARFAEVASQLTIDNYFLTGGFPWAINEFLRYDTIPPYVYSVYASWIQGALIRKNHSPVNLTPILRYLVERAISSMSVTNLARDCGIGSNHTAEIFLSILEHNYITMVSRWSQPGTDLEAPRKNRKFYPADPLLFHLFHDFGKSLDTTFQSSAARCNDPNAMGALVECLVASELRHRPDMYPLRYFLGKKEIDFVGREAIEVKYQNYVDIDEFQWVEKTLPGNMTYTVITKNTISSKGRFRAIPLKDWLLET